MQEGIEGAPVRLTAGRGDGHGGRIPSNGIFLVMPKEYKAIMMPEMSFLMAVEAIFSGDIL